MTSSIRARRWKTALLGAVVSIFATAAAAQEIGTTTAVTVLTTGQPPGASVRRLDIGTNVVANERLVTSKSGRAQLIFKDRSSLVVAPNSDLVLDEYIYDPKTKAGKVVFSTTKGFFRFVGGVISKKNKVEFRTPLATIALRGGIADVHVSDKSVVAIKHFGVDVVVTRRTPDGVVRQTRVLRNGYKATVTEQSSSVQIEKVTQAEIDGNLAKLEGAATNEPTGSEQPVADAGSSQEPVTLAPIAPVIQATPKSESVVDEKVPESEIIQEAQDNVLGVQEPGVPQFAYSGHYKRNPAHDFENSPVTSLVPQIPAHNDIYGGGQIEDGWFTAMVNGQEIRLPAPGPGAFTFGSAGTSSPFGPVSGSGFLSPAGEFFFYTLRETENAGNLATIFGGGTPLATESFPTSGLAVHRYQPGIPIPDVAGGDVLGLIDEYTLFSAYGLGFGNGTQKGITGGAAVVFDGSGPAQRSAMIGTSFAYYRQRLVEGGAREGPIGTLGGTRSSTRQSSADHPIRLSSPTSSMLDENRNGFFGVDAPDFFVTSTQDGASSGIRQPETSGFYETFIGMVGSRQGRYHANWFARAISLPTDLGSRQTTRTLFGYTGGIVEEREAGGVFAGDYVFHSNPDESGRVTIPGASPSGQTGLWIVTNADDYWVHVEMGLENIDFRDSFYRFGTPPIGGQSNRSMFIDDRRFFARDLSEPDIEAIGEGFLGDDPIVQMEGVFATAGVLNNVLPDGVTPCECEYLRWGYWFNNARRVPTPDNLLQREAVHIASWVAGEIPDAVDIPTTGTAAYAGHIVGNVKNGASYYVSAGRFTQQYNFGTDTGAFNVTNFDGASYSGAISASDLRNDFSGLNIQGGSNRTMNLRGSFFKSPSQGSGAIPAYVGGDFNVTGNGYKVGGTFAGER